MRLIVLVILLSSVQVAICQSDVLKNVTTTEIPIGTEKSPEEVTECNEERQRAIEDIKAGILKVENYLGLSFEKKDFKFEEFYSNYLISKYRIEQRMTGCMSDPGRICYFEEMNTAIVEKHGLTVDELKNAAKTEYEQFKLLDNEGRKKYIDFSYVYFWVDERAKSENTKQLQDKLIAKVNFKNFDFSKYNLKGFHAEVVIDEMGNVVSCRVVSKNFPSDANEAVQKAIKEIGGWESATLYGSKVKSKTGFSFIF
jgi:hypothetical protein